MIGPLDSISAGAKVAHGFDEPPSIDLSHVPPAMGDSLCFTSPTRLDPRQLAVLAKGWMRSTLKERIVIQAVRDGTLSIDEAGRVWRHFKYRTRAPHTRFPIPAKRAECSEGPSGYLIVTVTINGVSVRAKAHRLVWQFFHGDIPEGLDINHLDGVKPNNRPANLEVATRSENIIHDFRVLATRTMVGENNSRAIFTEPQVSWIKEQIAERRYTGLALAAMFGVDSSTIYAIKNGKTWNHIG